MRTVVAYELVSLDGVAEDPDRFITAWDETMDANLAQVIGGQDAVILGRRSFDEWASFWPTSDLEPFASFINSVTKYVATSRRLSPQWTNATVVEGELVPFVRALKKRPGKDIGVHASISVVRQLLGAGVIDELKLVVAPSIAASGQRLLVDLPPLRLEAIRSALSPSGHLLADYRVIG